LATRNSHILPGVDIALHISREVVTDDHIILIFVGILATFTVLSNFAQVMEVKSEFKKKTNDMKADIQTLSKTVSLPTTGNSGKIDPKTYQILGIDHSALVENYYVLIKDIPVKKESLEVFVKRFRDEYCKKASNINLLDDPSAYPPITKYPLVGDEYVRVADNFVAMAIFESDDVWMYPYQDALYKEYGGTNWKKTPAQ
jgi:hypothetical protein